MKILLSIIVLLLSVQLLYGDTDLVRETKMDSVLASVNGEPVTLLDVLIETGQEEKRLSVMYSGEQLYNKTYELRKKYVADIIERKLVYNKYKEQPFEIQTQDIENMIDRLAVAIGGGNRESLRRRIKEMGTTMREIRKKAQERIAVDVLLYNNCIRRVYVTPKEVYEAYKNDPDRWSTPGQISFRLIQIRKETKNTGSEELLKTISELLKDSDDATFRKIARKYSEIPNAPDDGTMGWIETQSLRPEFAEALKGKKTGDVTGPVDTQEAWYFIRITDMKKTQVLPFRNASKIIEQQLKRDAVMRQKKLYIDELKKEAVIKYFF